MKEAQLGGKNEIKTMAICLGGWVAIYFALAASSYFGWGLLETILWSGAISIPLLAIALLLVSYSFICQRHPGQPGLNLIVAVLTFSMSWPFWFLAFFALVAITGGEG